MIEALELDITVEELLILKKENIKRYQKEYKLKKKLQNATFNERKLK